MRRSLPPSPTQLQRAYPEDRFKTIEAVPLQEQIVGTIRPMLRLLMGAVAIILLIVGANITHLQLVRAARQLRSVTIRTALGASRGVLAGRALLEALLHSAAGCSTALLLAVPALKLFVRLAPPEVPRLADVHLNLDVLLFSFALGALLMAATAVLPVWRSWHIDPAAALRQDTSRGTEDHGAARLRNGFLVAEVALTLTLSVAAVMLTRQLIQQSKQNLGFSAENLITLDSHTIDNTPPPTSQTDCSVDPGTGSGLSNQSGEDAASAPGRHTGDAQRRAGRRVYRSHFGRAHGLWRLKCRIRREGPAGLCSAVQGTAERRASPCHAHLFTTMHIPLLRGRSLNADDRLSSPTVLLINQELARKIFPGQDPIGQQVMCGYDDKTSWWTIVGVVGDIRDDSPAAAPTPTFYVPIAQHPGGAGDMQLIVRTRLVPSAMLDTLTNRLKLTHPEIAIKATTMRENIGDTQRSEQFRTPAPSAASPQSAFFSRQWECTASPPTRSRSAAFEFGLRIALGASRFQLLALVLRKALGLAAIGIVIGMALSFGVTRVLGSIVGKLPAFDLPAYAFAVLAVLTIALLATLLPAQAAAGVDPMTVLRSE